MTSQVLSRLFPVFFAVAIATAWGQEYDAPWGHAGMIDGNLDPQPMAGCAKHVPCHESCGEIAHQFVGDVKQVVHHFIHCHSCRSLCCGYDAPCANGFDGDAGFGEHADMPGVPDNSGGSGGIEIVPRPWPPGYQEVPPPRTDPLSIMTRQRDAYSRNASRRVDSGIWDAIGDPSAPEPFSLDEPPRIMATATDAAP